jgi:hypothetical protein
MIPKICLVGLLTAILAYFLGEMGFKNKKLLSLLAILLLLCGMKDGAGKLVDKILSFSEVAGIGDACRSALKTVGLGYLFGFTSDVCTELGESGVAKAVNVVGKIEIMLVVLPYFEKTLTLGLELLK